MTRWSLFAAVFAAAAVVTPALAQSAVTLSPVSAHPSQLVAVSGTGFAASEAVDVYLDTTDMLLLVSSATGTLTGSLTLPASVTPGTHYVTVIGRRSGDAAQMVITLTAPWLQPGFGVAGQNDNPYENTITTGNASSLGVRWSVANAKASGAVPVVTAGRIYNATFAGLQALSTVTGAVIWTALPTDQFYGSPTIAGNTVYIGGTSGNIYSINAVNGRVNWTTAMGGYTHSSPVVANGIVYIGCSDGKVYAFQAKTGKIVWTYTTNGVVDSSPTVVAGIVYVGSQDDSLYASNAATGALQWSYATGDLIESSPEVVNGVAYVSSDDGKIYAIRTIASPVNGNSAGSLLWSDSGAAFQVPAVAHGKVFYGYGTLYAVNSRSGAQIWSFTPDIYLRGHAIVANGIVYVTSASGILYGIDEATGAEVWHAQSGGVFLGGPTISDGAIYVNAYESGTTAFALQAGTDAVRPAAPARSSLHPDMSLPVSHPLSTSALRDRMTHSSE